jgi:hypothetical protein
MEANNVKYHCCQIDVRNAVNWINSSCCSNFSYGGMGRATYKQVTKICSVRLALEISNGLVWQTQSNI